MLGVGSALLTFLETSAKQMGYRKFNLETTHSNRQNVNFYEKNGYFRIDNYGPYIGEKRQSVFQRHCDDCIYRTELMLRAQSRKAG